MFAPRAFPATSAARLPNARLLSFAVIGIFCTVAFAFVFWALRQVTGPLQANLGALSATIVVNFVANRRLTFRAHQGSLLFDASGYAVVYLLGLAASSAALWIALELFGHPTGVLELFLAVGSSGMATVIRFALLTRWVFRQPMNRPIAEPARG